MKISVRTAAGLAVLVLLGGCRWPWENAADADKVVLSGTVDARQVDLSFQVGGRIARLLTDEGRAVRAGDSVAELDASDLRLAADRAGAQTESARKALASLKAGARPQELRSAQAALAQAEADRHFADQEVTRTQQLVAQHFVAPEQLDRVRSTAESAAARVDQAGQALSLLRAGARKEDIERATADVAAAEAGQRTIERQLAYVALVSPASGVVSVRLAEAGQVVPAGQPVFRLAELSRPRVRAYLAEPDLARVKLGQPAQVRIDGLPGRVFNGRLAFIAPQSEFTPKTV
ncbi:MAG: efflux RND transporter periplasmic adaptor subunit, partial [Ramlibacter sp.]